MRRRVLEDDDYAQIIANQPVAFASAVEDKVIRASASCIHGDLHCGNVLVNQNGDPLLIDFGDVGPGFTCLDPVTLELSLLFHPEAVRLGFSAEPAPLAESWPDIDRYTAGSSLGILVEACREWAYDVGTGDLDVIACGYAFVIRQLKYATVDSAITMKLLNSIVAKLL